MSGFSPSSSSRSGLANSTNSRAGIDALRRSSISLAGAPSRRSQPPIRSSRSCRLLVAVVDQRGVGGVERDPRARCVADAARQPVVVGMDVRDHHALDVGDVEAGLAEPGAERFERDVGVPAGVDDERPAVGFERVDEDVTQHDRERYGDAPQPGADLLDGRKRLALDGLRLHAQSIAGTRPLAPIARSAVEDHVGGAPRHRHDRPVEVPGHHHRQDRAIDDTQVVDATNSKLGVDDVGVGGAHRTRADGVVAAVAVLEARVDDGVVVLDREPRERLVIESFGDRFGSRTSRASSGRSRRRFRDRAEW